MPDDTPRVLPTITCQFLIKEIAKALTASLKNDLASNPMNTSYHSQKDGSLWVVWAFPQLHAPLVANDTTWHAFKWPCGVSGALTTSLVSLSESLAQIRILYFLGPSKRVWLFFLKFFWKSHMWSSIWRRHERIVNGCHSNYNANQTALRFSCVSNAEGHFDM